MKTPSVEQLNKNFSFQNVNHTLRFKIGRGDIPLIEIHNEQASATIRLQGAHVLSWVPTGEAEVIWVSDEAKFAPAKSVRGGIPICWSWFGAKVFDRFTKYIITNKKDRKPAAVIALLPLLISLPILNPCWKAINE